MRSVTQEDPSGCGLACISFIVGKSYSNVKKNSDNPDYASGRGYYCKEIVRELKKYGWSYSYCKALEKNKHLLKNDGTIVFIERSKDYPIGHYLIKTKKGWMNPWINYPNIKPAKSGFHKNLPGKAQWIIFALKN